MKTLFLGAGPLGIVYAHLLHAAGRDVTILARGSKYDALSRGEVSLVNGFSGERTVPGFKVVNQLADDDAYDLVVVLVRRNRIPSVLKTLGSGTRLENVLFMGNNVAGFDDYLSTLPSEKVLFGFPGAGGGWVGEAVEFVDSESPGAKRMPIRIGETDGIEKARTREIRDLFESAAIPVEIVKDIDGWLKYHAAFVIPICYALNSHDGDPKAVGGDKALLELVVRACKEAGDVLEKLGYTKRQPFKFNLFYWMPEFVTVKLFRGIFSSPFAEIAFAPHAKAAGDEFVELSEEFRALAHRTGVTMPSFDRLVGHQQSQ